MSPFADIINKASVTTCKAWEVDLFKMIRSDPKNLNFTVVQSDHVFYDLDESVMKANRYYFTITLRVRLVFYETLLIILEHYLSSQILITSEIDFNHESSGPNRYIYKE